MVNAFPSDVVVDGPAILARAAEIAPLLREQAADVEAARRLTVPVVEALRSTGVFRMAMPRAWGGPELDPLTQIEIIETLSRADASAGWCAMIGSDSGFYAAGMDESSAREIYANLDAVTAGMIMPAGNLAVRDGGYRLSGRWGFASGSTHADLFVAGAFVTENGVRRMLPSGVPERRIAVLPASRWQIIETWDAAGLAGTSSHDYAITDAFVPQAQTWVPGVSRRPEPLYAWRGMMLVNWLGVPLGIALGAGEVASSLLGGKVALPERLPVSDAPRVRAAVARAMAMVGSARSYVHDVIGRLWETVVAGDQPDFTLRAEVVGCYVHTATTCRDAVQLLVDTVGTAAVRTSSPLQRQLRDLIAVKQHRLGQSVMWEFAGGLHFDEAPPHPLF